MAAGHDVGELEVDQHQGADQEDQGRDELEDRDQGGVDARHPDAEDRKQGRERPEQDPKGPQRKRGEAIQPREPARSCGGGRTARCGRRRSGRRGRGARARRRGSRGRRCSARRGGRTGGAGGRSGRSGRGTSTTAATRTIAKPAGGLTIATRLPAKPEQAVGGVRERVMGMDVGRLDLRPCARSRAAAWRASCPPGARRRSRRAGPRTSTARGSLAGGRRRPRAGHYPFAAKLWLAMRRSGGTVDTRPSKGRARKGVWVRVPPPASLPADRPSRAACRSWVGVAPAR